MELTNQQYKFISEIIWGCVPVDKVWAMQTPIFKENIDKVLKQYPLLNKSL